MTEPLMFFRDLRLSAFKRPTTPPVGHPSFEEGGDFIQ
jgi:hypothetical protein